MADMIDFNYDYRNGEFTKHDYRFHACNARIETRKLYGDTKSARFISYATVMAGIVAKGNVYLRKDFDWYSRTTTRQVTRFLSEMCGAPISVHDLRKWRKEGETHCGIVFCDEGFIHDNF